MENVRSGLLPRIVSTELPSRLLTAPQRLAYTGHDLLIEAPLLSVPKERWSRIEDDLRAAASALPIREIHVIGDQDRSPFWISH